MILSWQMPTRRAAVPRCSGRQHSSAENIAGTNYRLVHWYAADWIHSSELYEPQKLLEYLLQPAVLRLSPGTVAVYLQSALKVFGSWCSELADHWVNDDLPRVRGAVDTFVERVSEFVSNPDIEVQERVRYTATMTSGL